MKLIYILGLVTFTQAALCLTEFTPNQTITKNPLSVLGYNDIEVPWYIWFSVIYSFFIIILIGPALVCS
jgi:hypothetical protein